MKIYVFSDSHGYVDPMLWVLRENSDYDAIVHLGDVCADVREIDRVVGITPVISIIGNRDFFGYYEGSADAKVITWENKRFYLCHGHREGAKSSNRGLLLAAKKNACSAVLFGHTHLSYCETIDGVTLFNPGSIGASYGSPYTYGIITLSCGLCCFETKEVPKIF